jgi:hypothetical protein
MPDFVAIMEVGYFVTAEDRDEAEKKAKEFAKKLISTDPDIATLEYYGELEEW